MKFSSMYKVFICTLLMFQTIQTMDNPDKSSSAKQLIQAIETDDFEATSKLLKLGIDANIPHINNVYDQIYPIEVAIHHGTQICQLLLSHGTIVTARAFTLAAQSDLLPIIQLFLESKTDVNLRSHFLDRTPLVAAAWSAKKNAPEICRLLINARADVNVHTKPFGNHTHPITALGGAVKAGNPKNIPLLLDAGAYAVEYFAHHLYSEKIISLLAKRHATLISSCVFVPKNQAIQESQKRISTFLLCCSKLEPSLPRDVQAFILTKLPTDLGNCMISHKLQGKPIPFFAQQATADALYNSTLDFLKTEISERLPKNFEQQFGDKIKETIAHRLAQEKLLCNNSWKITEETGWNE